jgi:hypothetical protein
MSLLAVSVDIHPAPETARSWEKTPHAVAMRAAGLSALTGFMHPVLSRPSLRPDLVMDHCLNSPEPLPSGRRKGSSTRGALHLDVHPAIEAGWVEKVVAWGNHARCGPIDLHGIHAYHAFHAPVARFHVTGIVGLARQLARRDWPEVVILLGEEASGDETTRAPQGLR